MKNYTSHSASYYKPLDILYVGFRDGGLESCYAIEDTPSGITVMYDEDGSVAGTEISCFSSRWGLSFPVVVNVDARDPFKLTINSAMDFPA